jgi:hypothetical protein
MTLARRIATGTARAIIIVLGLLCCAIAVCTMFVIAIEWRDWLVVVIGTVACVTFFRRIGCREF